MWGGCYLAKSVQQLVLNIKLPALDFWFAWLACLGSSVFCIHSVVAVDSQSTFHSFYCVFFVQGCRKKEREVKLRMSEQQWMATSRAVEPGIAVWPVFISKFYQVALRNLPVNLESELRLRLAVSACLQKTWGSRQRPCKLPHALEKSKKLGKAVGNRFEAHRLASSKSNFFCLGMSGSKKTA